MTRLLIADIGKNFGFILKQELEDEGYAVDLSFQGGLSMPDSAGREYDIILLDMLMPCLDHCNRIKRIKKNNPAAHIVIFSDSAALEETSSLLTAGAEACFARHEIEKMKKYLRGRLGIGC